MRVKMEETGLKMYGFVRSQPEEVYYERNGNTTYDIHHRIDRLYRIKNNWYLRINSNNSIDLIEFFCYPPKYGGFSIYRNIIHCARNSFFIESFLFLAKDKKLTEKRELVNQISPLFNPNVKGHTVKYLFNRSNSLSGEPLEYLEYILDDSIFIWTKESENSFSTHINTWKFSLNRKRIINIDLGKRSLCIFPRLSNRIRFVDDLDFFLLKVLNYFYLEQRDNFKIRDFIFNEL